MATEKPKTAQIDESAHDALASMMGTSRNIKGALSNAIRWLNRQDSDLRAILFDGVSVEAEADVLERLADDARVKAGRPSYRDAARMMLQLAADEGKAGGVLRELSFDEMANLGKALTDLMVERGKKLQREATSAQKAMLSQSQKK